MATMDDEQVKKVESQFIESVPAWFWRWGGIVFLTTSFLLANQIPLGTTISNLSTIYVEKQRAQIAQDSRVESDRETIISNILKKQAKTEQRLKTVEADLKKLKEEMREVKKNSHPPAKR